MPMACAIFTPRICAPRTGPRSGASARWRLRYVLHVKGHPPNLAKGVPTWVYAPHAGPLGRAFWPHPPTASPPPAGDTGGQSTTHEVALEPTGIAQWEYAAKDGVRGHAMCLRQRSQSIVI